MYIQKLKQAKDQSISLDEQVDVSAIEEWDNDIRSIDSIHVHATLTMKGNHIYCDFSINGTMILPCARTLVDVAYPFTIEASEQFTTSPYGSSDEDVHTIEGEVLDLTPFIKENIILEIPIRVFADEDTLHANTLEAGEGWELVTEFKQEEKVDPRFEKLKEFLDQDNQEDK
ncbi:hypothetical protein J416_01344 [Gracilibacillus halophilus YIM-C55.5]|uniref:DUF177 domain-containing protein n=1 Tax=Gracilibacillus halophilus YIM-C55.5 TaxID=1308866 RepID=N4WQD1_9BACI|nr:YceD family protein [Gracilibacillus halophilus]ENH98342.1 hypothetical protein J416_01344 [Gracilibacillus halophilus YIM-C55.5]